MPQPSPAPAPYRLGGAARVWLLTLAIAGTAGAIYVGAVRGLPAEHGPIQLPWWAIAVLFCIAEVAVVHVQFRRDAHSFSLSEIALVLGLFFTNPRGLALAQIVGAGLALTLWRRQSLLKLAFNLSHFALGATLATVTFHHLSSLSGGIGPSDWAAALVATMFTGTLSLALIFTAISLSEGHVQLEQFPLAVGFGSIVTLTNTSLALLGATVAWENVNALWLLIVPTGTLFLAYRAYSSMRQKNESLEFLYESTRVMLESRQIESAMISLLSQARKMFRAERAEVVVFLSGERDAAFRTMLGPGEELEVMKPVALDATSGVWARVASEGCAVLLARPIQNERIREFYESRGIRDAMVAPLRGESGVIGTLLVGNRLGDVSTFDSEDLKLFETLANQASVSLENGWLEQSLAQLEELKEQLRHQAFHDMLTGLANRALFQDRIEQALRRQDRRPEPLAVLFLDLDDFKSVNDTFGHAAGDELLRAMADRLLSVRRPADTASRLGGDEFAILLENTDKEGAIQVARRILNALKVPYSFHDTEVAFNASIGIALAEGAGESVDDLLRNGDVAMYMAKEKGKGRYEVFDSGMHAAAVQRLQLKADLRLAVERREFIVHYQPIIELSSDRIVGMEALVRWNHPTRGVISPAEFIPLAEESGLILPIGRFVLRQACHQARLWQIKYPSDPPLQVSVNLSARQLQQPDLVDEVALILRDSSLDPRSLILEITESVLVQDEEATAATLSDLKSLGIRLAIDDYGIGYSSIDHLRRLPVDILKIDKVFVDDIGKGTRERAIAQHIIEISGTLRLDTVGEGIERDDQLAELRALRCTMGQGFLFAKPLDREGMDALLQSAAAGTWRRPKHGWATAPARVPA